MDIIETLRANEWPSHEIDELIEDLKELSVEVKNKETLAKFNAIFGTSFHIVDEVFEYCDAIQWRSGSEFIFTGGRSEDPEVSLRVTYDPVTGKFIEAVYECDRYYRWSSKDHGFESLGDFQGKDFEEYAKDNDRKSTIVYCDVTNLQEMVKLIEGSNRA